MNSHSDFCPLIEILALESDHVYSSHVASSEEYVSAGFIFYLQKYQKS